MKIFIWRKLEMKKNGFSLIEVLIAVIFIGLAIASLVGANISFTQANGFGMDLSTAEFAIEQIKELTAMLPVIDPQSETSTFGPESDETDYTYYDDLDDFDNAIFSPPISAGKEVLNDFAAFSQQITVENVNSTNFEQVVSNHSSRFIRVTVKVFLNSDEISSASWIRARY